MPLPADFVPLENSKNNVGTYPHNLDPRKTSLAPARVVFFIGCKNVVMGGIQLLSGQHVRQSVVHTDDQVEGVGKGIG